MDKYTLKWCNIVKEIANTQSIFNVNNVNIIYRLAKITPKKSGEFVTLWKRNLNGKIIPFDINDQFDIIFVRVVDGQFIFSKAVLTEQGIISNNTNGKLAIRVYSPNVSVVNKQAIKTQEWQCRHFVSNNQI